MTETVKFNDKITYAKTMLAGDYLPLYVNLVKGGDYSVWVDSGTKTMYPQLKEAMDTAKVGPSSLRMVVQTHSHQDHIACNVALKKDTGCLIAGHKHYAHWHSDLERHFQEWARPVPELMPDTPALRARLTDWFDAPHHIDIFVDEGTVFDLGGGVTLTGYSVPGHMLNDLAWFESSTRTLLLGDGITATEWPHFHMHLTVSGYRSTIPKVARLVKELKAETIFLTHFGPVKPSDLFMLCEKSSAFLDRIDRSLIQVMCSKAFVTLEEIWKTVAVKVGKEVDFQALNTIHAHVTDFVARGLIKEIEPRVYSLR